MKDNFYNPLSNLIRIKTNFSCPEFLNEREYSLWAVALLKKPGWVEIDRILELVSLPPKDEIFIASLMQIFILFCELGRIPIFSIQKITGLDENNLTAGNYTLEIKIVLIEAIPRDTYTIAFKNALQLCTWMVKNPVTPDNKHKAFHAISEKVIKPLHKLTPSGKSTIPVLKVAYELGIPFMHMGAGVYQLGWGSKARRLDRSATEFDSAIGARLSHNKVVTANLLRIAGLPAPAHATASKEADALSHAGRLGFPLVIKPADRDRGEGVSVDVVDTDMIKSAFGQAYELSASKQVIVERQVSGVCHRLFIASGQLLYAVKRLPMSVKGDGQRTIAQLVDDEVSFQKQTAPWVRSEIQPIDERALHALAQAGYHPQSVPAEGAWAPLRRIESTADGGVDEEVTAIVHSENLSAAIAAANLIGLNVAGIDIISPDISRPWYENGAIINEVNFAPLFGGGEISRSYIPRFLAEFIDGNGKIPIEVFDNEAAALARQEAYLQKGSVCYFTTSTKTIDFSRAPLAMPFNKIQHRLRALVCRTDIDAITVCLPRSDLKGP